MSNQHQKLPGRFFNQPNPPQNSSGKRMLRISFLKSRNHTIKPYLEYNLENQNISEIVSRQFMVPGFQKADSQHAFSTRILWRIWLIKKTAG